MFWQFMSGAAFIYQFCMHIPVCITGLARGSAGMQVHPPGEGKGAETPTKLFLLLA